MGTLFHDWIDCNIIFSVGLHIFGILGMRKFWQVGILGIKKNGKIHGKKLVPYLAVLLFYKE